MSHQIRLRLPLIGRSSRHSTDESFTTNLNYTERRHQTHSPPKLKLKLKKESFRNLLTVSREGRNQSIDSQTTRIGATAKLDYIECYRNLPMLSQRNKLQRVEDTPNVAYLEEVDKVKLNPNPFGIVKRKGPETSIDIHNYSMGDNYANAFSEGLSHFKEIDILNLRENRLSELGSSRILSKITNKHIKSIILAGNGIGTHAVNNLLELLNEKSTELKHLDLENTKLSEKNIARLCNCISENKVLRSFSLAKNNIGDESAKYVKEMIKYNQHLRVLDLHWNNIRGSGGLELFDGLLQNDGLQQLDLSWNALGRNHSLETATMLSQALRSNTTLLHLDISYNAFSSKECTEISAGLNENHTLLGLHVFGNSCTLDSRGYIHPTSTNEHFENSHYFRRITHGSISMIRKEERTSCWVCEKWIEVKFKWIPGISGALDEPIYIHLECDEYTPEYMVKQEDGSYESTRVVPHGELGLFFSNFQGPAVSEEFSTTTVDTPLQIEINKQMYRVILINTNEFTGISCDLKDIFETKPRAQPPSYIPQSIETEFERILWTIPGSLFKEYKFDSEQKYIDGFEFDFKHTRIPNFVKKPEELALVKESIKKFYRHFRETYRYLSAVCGNEIFSIGNNALIEFLNQCNIFDEYFAITDVGVVWNSVNAQQNKDQIYNSGNGLCRYEFMEILVRIANDRYVRNKICANPAEAIEKMAQEHLLPVINFHDTNRWRLERYVCEEVDLVLKAHKPIIDAVYKKYSGKKALPGQKPFMSLEEFRAMCNDAGLQSSTFATREVDICYSQAMMTQVDELYQKKHLEMSFVEYIEALGRAADLANLPKKGEEGPITEDLPLSKRLENAMSYLLRICPPNLRDNFVEPTEETYRRMMYRPKKAN